VPLRPGLAPEQVSAQRWDGGDASGPVVVLAHGAGSRLDHPLHQAVCAAVAACGHTVVAFNFCYTQAGRRAPDRMPVLRSCYDDVLAHLRSAFPGRGLVIGGRSMGGRVASLLVADGADVEGLVLLNYPLVASNAKADTPPRTGHWDHLEGPVLFVQGTRDALFDRDVFAAACGLLQRAAVTVVDIPDADHSFGVLRRTGLAPSEVYAQVGRAISQWLGSAVSTVRTLQP
jgi:predicted alpha/beta-hydrolase family hydrolase